MLQRWSQFSPFRLFYWVSVNWVLITNSHMTSPDFKNRFREHISCESIHQIWLNWWTQVWDCQLVLLALFFKRELPDYLYRVFLISVFILQDFPFADIRNDWRCIGFYKILTFLIKSWCMQSEFCSVIIKVF